jgi:hypothetical protein
MTEAAALHAQAPHRPADPPREVAYSTAALGSFIIAYGVLLWLVVGRVGFLTSAWLVPVLYTATFACAVVLRSRSGARQRRVWVALTVLLAASLAPAALLILSRDSQLWLSYTWIFDVSGWATPLLVLGTWGLARRHGSWWWIGLVPAYGLDLASTRLIVASIGTGTADWVAVAIGWTIGTAALLLGGACCWLVDLLTTRPLPLRGRLEP